MNGQWEKHYRSPKITSEAAIMNQNNNSVTTTPDNNDRYTALPSMLHFLA
jgi:hypothetical protein